MLHGAVRELSLSGEKVATIEAFGNDLGEFCA